MKIIIPIDTIATQNEYINAERTNRYKASKIKKNCTELVSFYTKLAMRKGVKFNFPCGLAFKYVLKNARKDGDNIAFIKKFILDGFQEAEFLENDSLKNIQAFKDNFVVVKNCEPHVIIEPFEVKEVQEEGKRLIAEYERYMKELGIDLKKE